MAPTYSISSLTPAAACPKAASNFLGIGTPQSSGLPVASSSSCMGTRDRPMLLLVAYTSIRWSAETTYSGHQTCDRARRLTRTSSPSRSAHKSSIYRRSSHLLLRHNWDGFVGADLVVPHPLPHAFSWVHSVAAEEDERRCDGMGEGKGDELGRDGAQE
ncbi:unnamed protein product [Musa textilis]